jgi:flagellar biosynthesis protein FliQ
MSEQQLQRIQFVTTYYGWLQGLRFVPFGLVQLAFAAWLALPPPEGTDAQGRYGVGLLVMQGAMLLATGLYALVGVYYRRRFGDVRVSASTRQRMHRALGVSVVVGLVAGLLVAFIRKSTQLTEPPLSAILVLSALSLVWYWHWSGRVARHYLGVAAGFALLALLHAVEANPVYALLRALPFTTDTRAGGVTLAGSWGLAVVAMGVLDHRLLARTLGNEPEPEGEEVPE